MQSRAARVKQPSLRLTDFMPLLRRSITCTEQLANVFLGNQGTLQDAHKRGKNLKGGGADAQAVGCLLEPDAKLALQVLQPQPLPRLARIARPLSLPPRCSKQPHKTSQPTHSLLSLALVIRCSTCHCPIQPIWQRPYLNTLSTPSVLLASKCRLMPRQKSTSGRLRAS